jgi:hypothetical protein
MISVQWDLFEIPGCSPQLTVQSMSLIVKGQAFREEVCNHLHDFDSPSASTHLAASGWYLAYFVQITVQQQVVRMDLKN